MKLLNRAETSTPNPTTMIQFFLLLFTYLLLPLSVGRGVLVLYKISIKYKMYRSSRWKIWSMNHKVPTIRSIMMMMMIIIGGFILIGALPRQNISGIVFFFSLCLSCTACIHRHWDWDTLIQIHHHLSIIVQQHQRKLLICCIETSSENIIKRNWRNSYSSTSND